MEPIPSNLKLRADSGDPEAQLALAKLYDERSESGMARAWFARAAKSGNLVGLRLLATHLLTRPPIVAVDGVNMARAAADRGDAEAMHLCAMLAAQDERIENRWETAMECLRRAAGSGHSLAASELEFCSREEIRTLFDEANLSRRIVSEAAPRIVVVENFAPPDVCSWLITRASPRVAPAQVYDPLTGGGRYEQARSNSTVEFNIAESDLVLLMIRQRIASFVGVPLWNLESASVLHYSVGEQFAEHVDFLDPTVPAYARDIAERGQRLATFLLYLNGDYSGGETHFPILDWSYRGRTGGALLFWNLQPSGAPEPKSRHAGTPPEIGEKWLLSQWIRQRAAM